MGNVLENINIVTEKLCKSVEEQVYPLLDKVLTIDSKILEQEPIRKILTNSSNAMVIIANSFIILFTIYYIYEQLVSLYNGNNTDNIFLFIIKMVVVMIIVNHSYYICERILEVFSAFSETFDSLALNALGKEASFENLKKAIVSLKGSLKSDYLSLDGIITGIISFGSVNVLINLSIRYVTVILLILISPIALVCMASKLTEEFSKTWIKMLITNLLLQVMIKLVILIPVSISDIDNYVYKVIMIGTIYILYKINSFEKELMSKFVSKRR